MDALLRYTLYEVAIALLILEVGMMLFFAVAIILVKTITGWRKRRREKSQQKIIDAINSSLQGSVRANEVKLPNGCNDYRDIVEVLERFDNIFDDDKWRELKNHLIVSYLPPRTKKYATSNYWYKRQLAARCYFLSPELADPKVLDTLLTDERYLVRAATAGCIAKMDDQKELFDKMIRQMSRETPLSQFPYRDALIKVDKNKLKWIEELLAKDSDPKVSAICLDVLSTRYSEGALPIITSFIKNKDQQCRMLAIKALSSYPGSESERILVDHLEDSDWEMRAAAVNGLRQLYAINAITKMIPLLDDPIWWVRLQTALALKNMGPFGQKALESIDQHTHPAGYQIAQYTLALSH